MDNEKKYSSDDVKNFFGKKLKILRQNVGMTRKELAKKLGITEISVGNYERGLREPSIEKLIVLSKLFDVTIEELVGYDDSHFQDKIKEKLRRNMSTVVILGNGFNVVETVDGEFVLGNGRDFFSLVHSTVDTEIELSNEIVFFKSLKNLMDFAETIVWQSIFTSRTFKENFSYIINEKSEKNLVITGKDLNITKIYKEVSEELLKKLKNGHIYWEEIIGNSFLISLNLL